MSGDQLIVTVNGQPTRFDAAQAGRPLVEFLRDHLGLCDVKLACGEGACSACSVLVDGQSIPSCSVPLGRVRGAEIRSPAHLAGDRLGELIAAQLAAHGGVQCGFCSPGIVCSLYALATGALDSDSDSHTDCDSRVGGSRAVSEPEIAAAIGGHICRCTGYHGILRAAAAVMDSLGSDLDLDLGVEVDAGGAAVRDVSSR